MSAFTPIRGRTARYWSFVIPTQGFAFDNVSVYDAAVNVGVVGNPNPSVYGQPVTVTATVAAKDAGAGVPTGTVTFTEGATTLASGVAVDATGHASFVTSGLAVGSNTITATFTGSTGWLTSNGNDSAAPQVVNQDGTTTALTANPTSSVYGQRVALTATVTAMANRVIM